MVSIMKERHFSSSYDVESTRLDGNYFVILSSKFFIKHLVQIAPNAIDFERRIFNSSFRIVFIVILFFRNIGGEITQDGDFYMFENNRYRAGFLYKTMVMSAIITEGVKPTLTELEKFEASIDDAELDRIFLL